MLKLQTSPIPSEHTSNYRLVIGITLTGFSTNSQQVILGYVIKNTRALVCMSVLLWVSFCVGHLEEKIFFYRYLCANKTIIEQIV